MFPLIFCALCSQKFWRVRTFSGNSPKILCPKQVKTKKKGLHPKSIGVCVREVYCDNFMINNYMSVHSEVFRVRARAHAHVFRVCSR